MKLHIVLIIILMCSCTLRSRDWERRAVSSIDELADACRREGATEERLRSLEEYSNSKSEFVRGHLADAIGTLGERNESIAVWAVPLLVKLAQDPSLSVQSSAAKSFGTFGVQARPAIPHLAAIVKRSPGTDAAWNATVALGNIGEDDPQTLEALLFALNYEGKSDAYRYTLKTFAAEALAKLGKKARVALPDLKRNSDVPDPSCKVAVQKAISEIEKE